VAGVGTGGTITGVGQVLKGPRCRAARSWRSNPRSPPPCLSGGKAFAASDPGHRRAGFVPAILDRKVIDEVIQVENARRLQVRRGQWRAKGRHSRRPYHLGAAGLPPALKIAAPARKPPASGIVVIIPSFAERYVSTPLFEGLD